MAKDSTDALQLGRLFILGAGFSASAGVPLTSELVASTMARFAEECPGIFGRVDRYVRTCFGLQETPDYKDLSLSEICTFLHYIELKESGGGEKFSDDGSRENLALKHYLAKTIVALTPRGDAIPELYLQFAQQLEPEDVVITFNWDCLLEGALEQVGKEYSYTFEGCAIRLAKLHGSVNWRLGEPASPSLDWRPLQYATNTDEKEVFYCSDLQRIQVWSKWNEIPIGEVQRFLVLPGFGKAFDVRDLATLWYKPEFAFFYTTHVYSCLHHRAKSRGGRFHYS